MIRHSYDFVKQSFEVDGYTLLADSYKNGDQKLGYLCPNGHEHGITFYNWQSGYRCPKCVTEKQRMSIEDVRNSLLSEGYELLTKTYVNNKQRLQCVCNKGHSCSIAWAEWGGRGDRCGICRYENMSIRQMGSGNHNWLGGISFEPYCEIWKDKTYKEDIKIRDDYKCQNPYCEKNSSKLVIHHIDYNKKNCHPNNLITLCNSCNSKANVNREWYKNFYTAILNNTDVKIDEMRR